MLRDCDAVVLLAGFIGVDTALAGNEDGASMLDQWQNLSLPASKWGIGIDETKLATRPTIVPVTDKSMAVEALRNIATSSDANLEHVTSQGTVIPELVQLMTKMNDQGDDASSMSSKDNHSPEVRDARRSLANAALKEKMEIDLHDRKELEKRNRRLAESAGEMLHSLIDSGTTNVKKVIISAIIQQVQQPGSVPPEDVPALMTILRSTALEQLSLVQYGDDEKALDAALGFGRWIKLPTLMLGEARNAFKAAQDARKLEQKVHYRRYVLGLEASPELPKSDLPVTESHFSSSKQTALQAEVGVLPDEVTKEGGSHAVGAPNAATRQTQAASRGSGPSARTRSQTGTSTRGKSARRRDAKPDAQRDRLRKLRREQEGLRATLVETREAQRKKMSSASHSRAQDYAKAEFERAYAMGPMADKQTMFGNVGQGSTSGSSQQQPVRRRWRPQLGSVHEVGYPAGGPEHDSRAVDQLKQQLAQSLGTRSRPPQTESGNRRLQSFEVPRHMLPSSPMVPPRNPSAGAPMLNTSSSDGAPRGFSSAGGASQAEGAVQTRSQTAVASERNAAETFLTAHAMLNPVARNLIDRTTTARYMETRAAFIEANGWSPLLGQL